MDRLLVGEYNRSNVFDNAQLFNEVDPAIILIAVVGKLLGMPSITKFPAVEVTDEGNVVEVGVATQLYPSALLRTAERS